MGADKAKEEFEKTKALAEKGSRVAQFRLGMAYHKGTGVPKNDKEAVNWWRKAAVQGFATAQYNLGNMYGYGIGAPKDDKEAVKWYRKAAEQGISTAQYNLGYSYDYGTGAPKDDKEAVKWYRKAAEQGDSSAQFCLGVMFLHNAELKDHVTSYAWTDIAAANGYANAKKNKGIIAKEMTPEQIVKAEALAKEMIAKNPKLIKKP